MGYAKFMGGLWGRDSCRKTFHKFALTKSEILKNGGGTKKSWGPTANAAAVMCQLRCTPSATWGCYVNHAGIFSEKPLFSNYESYSSIVRRNFTHLCFWTSPRVPILRGQVDPGCDSVNSIYAWRLSSDIILILEGRWAWLWWSLNYGIFQSKQRAKSKILYFLKSSQTKAWTKLGRRASMEVLLYLFHLC